MNDCRYYDRTYGVGNAGSEHLKINVCRSEFTGNLVLSDTAPRDGWDVCIQLRGQLTTPVPFISQLMSSRDGPVHDFDNGPRARFGAGTTYTEYSVMVKIGICQGSGSTFKSSWQSEDHLAPG